MRHIFFRLAFAGLVIIGAPLALQLAPAIGQTQHQILIGAWVKPRQPGPDSIDALEAAIGRHLDFSMHYHALDKPFPTPEEVADKEKNRIPILSLGCGNVPNVAAGSEDAKLDKLASSIAPFGRTVEIRYCWEMNLPYRKIEASDYVAAARHVHDRFTQAGAKNVRWYFCPGFGRNGANALAYYPGDAYVDDIGIDVYDRKGEGFQAMFDRAYHLFDAMNKPLIIGETGALGNLDQGTFLNASTVTLLRTQYPKVAGVIYFDAAGPRGDWSLTPAGLAGFRDFAKAAE